MPKSKKKTKHLEEEVEKKEGKAKKTRTQRFLARLQNAWARLTSCMGRRKKPKKHEASSSVVPGPSSIGLEDEKVHVTSARKEKPEAGEDQSLKTHGQEKDKLTPSIDVVHHILQHNQEIRAQFLINEDVCGLYHGHPETEEPSSDVPRPSSISLEDEKVHDTLDRKENSICSAEEQILLHYHQELEQVQSYEEVYVHYYGQQEMEKHTGEEREDKKDVTPELSQSPSSFPWERSDNVCLEEEATTSSQSKEKHTGEETEDKKDMTPELSQSPNSCHWERSDNVCLEEEATTSTPSKETATVPLTLQSFTFHDLLGKGGFADVLLATDIIKKQPVAVKVVTKIFYTEYKYSLAERDILRISHQNHYLVHGLAAFQMKNHVYYVMELATRGSLHELIFRNKRLDFPTSQFVTAEVICGLQFLHENAIIHRDIKPSNILITREGHIKITDFGISITNVQEKTTDVCQGTPGFAAPEMIKHLKYGRGVDFFALGVTLYHMTTGYYPFKGLTMEALERDVIKKTPFFPGFLAPETVQILQGLLCKDQHSRLGVHGNIRDHPFFSAINWADVENRTVVPPEILVTVREVLKFTDDLCYEEEPCIQTQKLFVDFSFVCPAWSDTYYVNYNVQTSGRGAKLFSKWTSRK